MKKRKKTSPSLRQDLNYTVAVLITVRGKQFYFSMADLQYIEDSIPEFLDHILDGIGVRVKIVTM